MKDYYKILGVEPNSSKDDIKRAYRNLAKKWHPDVSESENAHEKFIEIAEAYEILFNDHTREQYDSMRNNSSYSEGDYNFGQEQQRARERGKYYSDIPFEEFFKKVFETIVGVGKSTLYGEDEFNKSITFKDYLKIGGKGWLSVLLLILTFTGVLAPVTIPILIKMNLIDDKRNRIVGIKNIFIGMLVATGFFLSIVFGIYIIISLEDIYYYLYFSFDLIHVLIFLIILGAIAIYFCLNKKINLNYVKKKGRKIKDFHGIFIWILATIFGLLIESDWVHPLISILFAGVSLFLFPMAIFFWLFVSKYKNFFSRLLIGIVMFVMTGLLITSFS